MTAHHLSKLVKAAARANSLVSENEEHYNIDMVRTIAEKKLGRFHQNQGRNRYDPAPHICQFARVERGSSGP